MQMVRGTANSTHDSNEALGGTGNSARRIYEGKALVMKHDADQRAVNVHTAAVVVNEAHFPEPIHEKADARTRGTDHFRERFLAYFGDDRYRFGFLAEVREQQQQASESFLAGVEKVIHQVRFHPDIPGKHVAEKAFGKFWFAMEQV